MTNNIKYEVTLYGFIEKIFDTLEEAINEACALRIRLKTLYNDVEIIEKKC